MHVLPWAPVWRLHDLKQCAGGVHPCVAKEEEHSDDGRDYIQLSSRYGCTSDEKRHNNTQVRLAISILGGQKVEDGENPVIRNGLKQSRSTC